ncbi:MAG: hypothetical protein AAGI07_09465, partial [Bacteroidota bacterium]
MVSCDGEFRPDPIDPRLPVYSAEGYRAAGALVDGEVWRYLHEVVIIGGRNTEFFFYESDSSLIISISGDILAN